MNSELLKITPSFLWFLFALIVFLSLRRPLIEEVLPHLTGLKIRNLELTFVQSSMDSAFELAEKNPQWRVEVSETAKNHASRRTIQHRSIVAAKRILWVDDAPENNRNEIQMLRQLHMTIETATSTEEALARLRTQRYDLLLSDMARAGEATAGGFSRTSPTHRPKDAGYFLPWGARYGKGRTRPSLRSHQSP